MKQDAKLVSVTPGKSIVVKFENSNITECNECSEIRSKKTLFSSRNGHDIVVESLDKPRGCKPDFLPVPKPYSNFPVKLRQDNDQLINVFSSVDHRENNDSINFNWDPN
jgi:ribosome-binding protein aMBF1 (putative translation factor)